MYRGLLVIMMISFFTSGVSAQWSMELETGLAFESYNEVRIPNETGTFFDFTRDFSRTSAPFPFRFRPAYTFGKKNHVLGLVALLALDYDGPPPFAINFQGVEFSESENLIIGFYKFNSYRLTYRRDLVHSDRFTLALGATAKLRDATVRLGAMERTARKDDLGFVPLIHLYLNYNFGNWGLVFEGDGLTASQGRAFDLYGGVRVRMADDFYFKAGYRMLEGGADVEEVFNFALIHFASFGFQFKFGATDIGRRE